MVRRILSTWFAFVFLFIGVIRCSPATEADFLSTLRAAHPRLFLTREDERRIDQQRVRDPLLERLIQQNTADAVQMLKEPSIEYKIPDGKRLLVQCRTGIQRVMAMAMAYRMTGERRFADGAIEEMLVAASFKDWNPSHFLDTAEMTTALAVGYDWLYDEMSSADRSTVRNAIVEKGLLEGKRIYKSHGWWTTRNNNWNQVCNGGMILGALAVAEDKPGLAREIIAYARASIPRGLSAYIPDGGYPEGPAYWKYGTTYTCLTIDGLHTALGDSVGIEAPAAFEKTGWFYIHTISPLGHYFNFADCSARASSPATGMFLLAELYDEPAFAQWHRRRLQERLAGESKRDRFDRFFPLEIAWYDAGKPASKKLRLPLDSFFDGRQDIVTARSRWDDPRALYVGFKGGDNRVGHGHMDIGSFVLEAEGVRWALDLGSDNYNLSGYFGTGSRWKYYRLNNRSHNTLVINGQLQNDSAHCDVVSVASEPDCAGAIVDMTDAYKDQVASARRGIELVDRKAVHIRDELEGVEGRVRWGMVTDAKIEPDGRRAILTKKDKTLIAVILSPDDAQFEVLSSAPPTKREHSNRGTHVLAIEIETTTERPVSISVLLQAIDGRSEPVVVQPIALDEWRNMRNVDRDE